MVRPLAAAFFTICAAFSVSLCAEARTHVVQSGETLALVAATEHVSIADLARFNQWEGPTAGAHLIVGQVLALDPVGAAALPPPAAAPPIALAELRIAEPTSNPSAGSDLAMWGGATKSSPSRTESGSPVRRFANRILRRASTIAFSLTRSAMRFIGTPYVFGGTSAAGFDCSGYVQHVFAMLGIHLPRTADAQYYAGASTHGRLVVGDLVFFQTYEPGPSHVGIYLGNGHFVHSSSSHGVMVSSLNDSYWAARYIGGRRYAAAARASLITRRITTD